MSTLNPAEYLDALLTLPKLYGGSVSRDGKWAAWIWMGVGEAIDVYAAPTDGSASPIQLTQTSQNTYFISWLPSSDGVIVAQDNHGDERLRLFRVDLTQPNVLIPLTEESPNYYIRGGQLHPNGEWLIYAANANFQTGEEIEPTWIYRHDLQTGERKPITQPAKGAYYFPVLNSTGTHILYNRKDVHPAGYQLWLTDIEGNNDREIFSAGDDKKVYGSWLPDGKRLLIRAETETHFRVGVWSLENESIRWLIDDPNRYIESVHAPFGSDQIVISEVKEARLQSSLLDLTTGIETQLTLTHGNLQPIAPSASGEWVGKYYSAQQITDLVRFSPRDLNIQTFKSLTGVSTKTRIMSSDLAIAEDFRWQSVDGLQIQGWLYRTPHPAKGTIVYVHGGPTAHSEDALDDQIQFFVSQRFNVLDPNYRGSTGFSRMYTEAIKADGWGGREQEDIRAGIEALIAKGIAVEGKVGITGTSYGGYSSWHAITHFPLEIVSASAPICGMTDLVIDYETTRPDLRPYSAEMMGGTPNEMPQRYHERSPIHFVENIKGRLLIIQGLQDPNVTPENVSTVKKALDKAGIEYEMLVFDNEGHGIDRPENLRTLYTHLAAFFTQAFDGSA
ncbi:MAG: prolyl oligopeptidase family serine peptidase [Chloroflexi bacterium]|nr:prolyl oligopeptidase family serine peptidase [Chloroflexota bacterium]MCC6892181.1 S9 family peptidase [Anaerolineae bacterium]